MRDISAILFGLLLTSGVAFAGDDMQSPATKQSDNVGFINVDQNRDGKISRAEAKVSKELADNFDAFDENKDGSLSLTEYQKASGQEG
jgi:hypothetical protein